MKFRYHCAFPQESEMLHVYVYETDTGFVIELRDKIGGKPIVLPRSETTLYDAVKQAESLVKENAWLAETEVLKLLSSADKLWKV